MGKHTAWIILAVVVIGLSALTWNKPLSTTLGM
jgi:hypothetical protein